jgi:hypothetical protein
MRVLHIRTKRKGEFHAPNLQAHRERRGTPRSQWVISLPRRRIHTNAQQYRQHLELIQRRREARETSARPPRELDKDWLLLSLPCPAFARGVFCPARIVTATTRLTDDLI